VVEQEQPENMEDVTFGSTALGYIGVPYGLEQVEGIRAIQLQGEQGEQ